MDIVQAFRPLIKPTCRQLSADWFVSDFPKSCSEIFTCKKTWGRTDLIAEMRRFTAVVPGHFKFSSFVCLNMPETCQKNNESMFSSRPLGARPKSAYFTISWCGKCAEMCLIFHHGIVAGGCSKHHGALKWWTVTGLFRKLPKYDVNTGVDGTPTRSFQVFQVIIPSIYEF